MTPELLAYFLKCNDQTLCSFLKISHSELLELLDSGDISPRLSERFQSLSGSQKQDWLQKITTRAQ